MKYDAKDLALASKGREKIEWADETMPVLRMIRERFEKEKAAGGKKDRRLPSRHLRDG